MLRGVKPMAPGEVAANTVRGQYVSGWVEGRKLISYRDEPEVAPDSQTETFVALKLGIDSWRWAGVPFYLRTGKAMPSRVTEIAVQFKRAPLALFARAGRAADRAEHPRHPGPARRGHPAALRRQGARAGAPDPQRQHGLPLRLQLRGRLARRVRDAAARRDDRRRQPLHPQRRGRARVGDPRPDPRGVGVRPGRPAPLLRAPEPGARRPPTSCWSATGGRGASREPRSAPSATEDQAVHRRLMRFGEAESLATPMWEERDTTVQRDRRPLASLWDVPIGFDDGGDPLDDREGPAARARIGPQPDRHRGRRGRRPTGWCTRCSTSASVIHRGRSCSCRSTASGERSDRRAHQHALPRCQPAAATGSATRRSC